MLKFIIDKLFALSRPTKRFLQVTVDCALVTLSFWLAMALRMEGIFTTIKVTSWITLVPVMPITIFTFAKLGLYRAIVRHMAETAVTMILVGATISASAMFVVNNFFGLEVPRSVPIMYFFILVLATGGIRLLMKILYLTAPQKTKEAILIYGAGEAGRLLMMSVQESEEYRIELIIDDNPLLQGTRIGRFPIFSYSEAKPKIGRSKIKTALIALDENDPEHQRQLAQRMFSHGLEVRILPKVTNLIGNNLETTILRELQIEDLIGRTAVPPEPLLMGKTTAQKTVLITGAGGSIGSELCRQVLRQAPRSIVLLDTSEYALYQLLEELSAHQDVIENKVKLVPVLGSVTSQRTIRRTISENRVETIFHAAAFKHVPLVEDNVLEAVKNNIFGTHVIAQEAGRSEVKNFTLVSSDKAVRPSNVMGATKRLAEIIIQTQANSFKKTKYCAVRFGNVLGSSGSVIPKFEKQISSGGPITLTHPDITRYFMSIPEATQLVIQASAMADNGEIYFLDMGEPVKIVDLAKTLARLRGRNAYLEGENNASQTGILIKVLGLRPGEKLHEELLISGDSIPTIHPKIAQECYKNPTRENLELWLQELKKCATDQQMKDLLKTLPLGYKTD